MAKGGTPFISVVLLVAGVALLIWGSNLYGAFGNKLTRAIDGSIDTKTALVLALRAICSLLGLVGLMTKTNRPETGEASGWSETIL